MSHIERGDDFYIVLPSNVINSGDKNTPSNYHTQLINALNLSTPGNHWEVGLVEISFVNAIKTIDKREQVHICQKQTATLTQIPISLEAHINEVQSENFNAQVIRMFSDRGLSSIINHADFSLVWHANETKFSITITNPDIDYITMDAYTAFVLGFTESRMLSDDELFFDASKDTHIVSIPYDEGKASIALNKARAKIYKSTSSSGASKHLLFINPANTAPAKFQFNATSKINAPYRISKSINIPEGYYQTSQRVIEAINNALTTEKETKFRFSYDENINRIKFTSSYSENTTFLRLDPTIASVFGFAKISDLKNKEMEAGYPPDLRRGIYSLYVYCDLCMETYVGNALVPLLRTVSYNAKGGFGETITVLYDNPIYVPLNKHTISNIEITICDDTGHVVPFVEGKTVLTLHFRRV